MFANLFKQNIQGLMADWPGGVADVLLRHFCFYLGKGRNISYEN